MKKRLLTVAAFCSLYSTLYAQTAEITQRLQNYSFEENISFPKSETGNFATSGSANSKSIQGWEVSGAAAWSASASFEYGTGMTLNGKQVPVNGPENAGNAGLGITVGWGAAVSYSQQLTLPAGKYKIECYSYNTHTTTQGKSLLGFVSDKINALSSKTNFTTGVWEKDEIEFILEEETSGKIQIGLGAVSGGSTSNAIVIFDGLKIYQYDMEEEYNTLKHELLEIQPELNNGLANYINNTLSSIGNPSTTSEYNSAVVKLTEVQNNVLYLKTVYENSKQLYDICHTLYIDSKESTNTDAAKNFNAVLVNQEEQLDKAYTEAEFAKINDLLTEGRNRYIVYASPNEGKVLNYDFLVKDITYSINGWNKSYYAWSHANKKSTEKNNGDLAVTQEEGFIENWNGGNFDGGELSYTLTNLPIGVYSISAYTFDDRKSGKVDFFAGDKSVDLDASTNLFSLSKVENVEVGSDGTLKVGLRVEGNATNWIGISHLSLVKTGNPDLSPLWEEMQKTGKDIDQSLLPSKVAKRLNNALNANVSEEDEVAWAMALDELTAAVNIANEIIIPYSELKSQIKTANEIIENSEAESEEIFNSFNNSLNKAVADTCNIYILDDVNAIANNLKDAQHNYVMNAQPKEGFSFDFTYLLNNPDLNSGNINGWTLSEYQGESGFPKYSNGAVEFWHCSFKLSQNVNNLPKGEYMLSVQAAANDYQSVKVIAGNQENVMSNISLSLSGESFGNVANKFASERDKYRSYVSGSIVEDGGSLNIGISNSGLENWVVFDDFKLMYLGENTVAYYNNMTKVLSETKTLRSEITEIPEGVASYIDNIISEAENVKKDESSAVIISTIERLNYAKSALNTVKENYSSYLEIKKTCEEYLDATDISEGRNKFESNYVSTVNILNESNNADNISICTNILNEARNEFINSAPVVKEGKYLDVTYKVMSADCNSTSGWTKGGDSGNFQAKSDASRVGEYDGKFVEKWDSNPVFTKGQMPVSQTISNLPEGVYELSAAVFRLNQNEATNEYSLALAFNDAEEAVKSEVMNYYTVKGYVGSDGNAIIGLKALLDYNSNWNGLGDVKLRYLGKEVYSYKSMQNDLYSKLVAMNDTMTLSGGLKDKIETTAIPVSDDETEIANILSYCTAMRNTVVNIQETVIPYRNALAVIEQTENLIKNSEGGNRESFISSANSAINAIDNTSDIGGFNGHSEHLTSFMQAYMLSGAKPTNGTYFDLSFAVKNRNFANGTNDWLADNGNLATLTNPDVNTYEYSGTFIEHYYNGDNVLETANGSRAVYQTLDNMPAGMYNIKAAAFGQRVWIGEGYSDKNISLYLNDKETEIKSNKLYYTNLDNVLVSEGESFEFGIRLDESNKYNWIGLGDVQILYYGDLELNMYDNSVYNSNFEYVADANLYTNADAESWRTLCLPFDYDISAMNDIEVRFVSNVNINDNMCMLSLSSPVSMIEAGKVYLMQTNGQGVITFDDVHVMAEVSPESQTLTYGNTEIKLQGHFSVEDVDGKFYSLYNEKDVFTLSSDNKSKSFQATLHISDEETSFDKILLSVDGVVTSINNSNLMNEKVDVYNVTGILIRKQVERKDALNGLQPGIYIVDGKKTIKR